MANARLIMEEAVLPWVKRSPPILLFQFIYLFNTRLAAMKRVITATVRMQLTLFDLPLEIRELIYGQAFVKSNRSQLIDMVPRKVRLHHLFEWNLPHSLFGVNRRIRYEATRHFFRTSTFGFGKNIREIDILYGWAATVTGFPQLFAQHHIRSVVGIDCQWWEDIRHAKRVVEEVEQLPNLKHLELRFGPGLFMTMKGYVTKNDIMQDMKTGWLATLGARKGLCAKVVLYLPKGRLTGGAVEMDGGLKFEKETWLILGENNFSV
jgi:hypothetical protein